MELKNQVCNLEQAKKLVELKLGVISTFSWVLPTKMSEPEPSTLKNTRDLQPETLPNCLPALTVAELGALLPSIVHLEEEDYYLQGTIGNRQGDFFHIWFQSSLDNVEWEIFPAIEEDTEAEARAAALIWLIENRFLDPLSLSL